MYQYKEAKIETILPGIGNLLGKFDPGARKEIFQEAARPQLQKTYLAFEQVRKGGRATAEIFNGLLHIASPALDSGAAKVDPTGFEGYFHGFENLTNEQKVKVQARIGAEVLRKINHEWEYPVARRMRSALKGEEYDVYALVALGDYGSLYQQFRGLAYHPQADRQRYQAFREETYDQVSLLPGIEWDLQIGPGSAPLLRQEMSLGFAVGPLDNIQVPLNFRELEGYNLMMEFGRLGHPLVRAIAGFAGLEMSRTNEVRNIMQHFKTHEHYQLKSVQEITEAVLASR